MKPLKRLTPKSAAVYALSALILLTTVMNLMGVISLRMVATNSMQGTIDQGSLVISENWLKPQVGDIAIYRQLDPSGTIEQLVVHRVIAGSSQTGFTFQGDNNQSADPEMVPTERVVGVVQFWIPGLAQFASWPILLLLAAAATFGIAIRKNLKTGGIELFQKIHSLTGWKRKAWLTVVSVTSIVLIFSGLSLVGALRIVHPQVGPNLPVGTSTNSIVVILPSATCKPGNLAIAKVNFKTSLVRVEAVRGQMATVTSTLGRIAIPSADIQGPIVLFVPFVGSIFEPFDK